MESAGASLEWAPITRRSRAPLDIRRQGHTDVTFQPMFYFMGHISKFAKPGARVLKSRVTGSYLEAGRRPTGILPGESTGSDTISISVGSGVVPIATSR